MLINLLIITWPDGIQTRVLKSNSMFNALQLLTGYRKATGELGLQGQWYNQQGKCIYF